MALAEGLAKPVVVVEQQLDQAAGGPVIASGIEQVEPLTDEGAKLFNVLLD